MPKICQQPSSPKQQRLSHNRRAGPAANAPLAAARPMSVFLFCQCQCQCADVSARPNTKDRDGHVSSVMVLVMVLVLVTQPTSQAYLDHGTASK